MNSTLTLSFFLKFDNFPSARGERLDLSRMTAIIIRILRAQLTSDNVLAAQSFVPIKVFEVSVATSAMSFHWSISYLGSLLSTIFGK